MFKEGNREKHYRSKQMGKQIKKAIKKEKSRYFNEEIDFKHDSKASWKKVNDILGNQLNFSPGGVLLQNSDGQN